MDTVNVKRDDQARHDCLGERYDLKKISAKNIAYAAVVVSNVMISYLLFFTHKQARFALSSKSSWKIKDEHFHYRSFYQEVVQKLSNVTDPWVEETLGWWNM